MSYGKWIRIATLFPLHGRHENVSGYYRVSVYFIAKVAVDLLSTRLFPLFFFTGIVYFMLGTYYKFVSHLIFY